MHQSLTEKQQYWSEQLQRAEESGITLAEYARAHNIEPQKLYQWRSTLKKQVTTSVTTETHFARALPVASSFLTVHLPTAQLEFSSLPDADWLSRLISASPTSS